MSNHNYSQYSNKSNKSKKHNAPKPAVEETVESTEFKMESAEPAIIMDPIEVAEPMEETVETVSLPKTVTGTVVNCTKLNVRSNPAIDADIVALLNVNAEVAIDPSRSTNEWLKITTTAGVEGYCMRKFVSAKL